MIYVRTIFGQNYPVRKFGPKPVDSPTVGKRCPACNNYILAGEFTTLVPLGPGEDPDERRKARVGTFYTAVAVEIHWACATGNDQ